VALENVVDVYGVFVPVCGGEVSPSIDRGPISAMGEARGVSGWTGSGILRESGSHRRGGAIGATGVADFAESAVSRTSRWVVEARP